MGGMVMMAAVLAAAQTLCTPDRLAGDWSIETVRKDGSPGSIMCGLGVDRDGRITWSTCHRDGLFGGWFRIEGTLALVSTDGQVEGRARDGVIDITITGRASGCARGETPSIRGSLDAGKGFITQRASFVGRPMSAREVRRLEAKRREATGRGGCDTAAEGCRP
jgi:hypothetical protein